MTYHRSPGEFFEAVEAKGPTARKAQARQQRKKEKASTSKATPLTARNPRQETLIQALHESPQVFAIGPAGTGKTYLASQLALRQVIDGRKERVVICRSTFTKPKHRLGFRPGNQDEKIADWLVPIMDGFRSEASPGVIDKMRQEGKIEFLAFETMRGRSIPNAVVLLDEAQNCDLDDLRMFLTRIGEGSQVVVSGDLDQIDIENSGLSTVLQMISGFISAEVVRFLDEDVVRSAIAKEWVAAFGHLRDPARQHT